LQAYTYKSRIANPRHRESTLIKIAKALGVSMAELFTDKDVLRDVNSIDTT